MCGICGLYDFGGDRPADAATIEAMTAALAHRGPDDVGVHLSGGLGLGFRRLSIIDLEGGHQPMSDSRGDRLGRLQRRDLQLPGSAA